MQLQHTKGTIGAQTRSDTTAPMPPLPQALLAVVILSVTIAVTAAPATVR
ncbi:unnamed protein product [Haemonchus placei]|uniref:Secreted protein n=1 Tax=Haemonchus placei TaxID=6290 RepID=A0A0N4WVC7_HAEPC|nr:unnamed protein product [Haemonchus placei]